MILIHGDCGSGKSRALHALESESPAGYRPVYVPVPTLEFGGLARWCLDRLRVEAGADPVASLRALASRSRLLVLVDDADRLPLETSLALRQLEREAAGKLAIVAACGSEHQRSSPIVALGEPAAVIALALDRVGSAEEAAAEVRDIVTLEISPRPARPQQLAPQSAPPPPRVRVAPVPPSAVQPARSVPLGLAVALACTAFLIPVAFGAGYVLGGQPREAVTAQVTAPALPDVAAAPPAPREREDASAQVAAALREVRERTPAAAPPAPAPSAAPARQRLAAESAPSAPRVAAGTPASPRIAASAPRAAARVPETSAVVESWGAPALISVAPARDGP